MTHVCGRASLDKDKILNVFNKQLKTTDKNAHCSGNTFADNHRSKTDGQHKMKRLRSRKERSHLRRGGKKASKHRSHHHPRCRQSSTDMAPFQSSCHISCHCPPRRDAPFASVVPAAQEPSVITDSRLIGHHGLFNREVKSIDIERLLSEQRKLEKSGQQAQENNNPASHQSSPSHVPSLFSTHDLLGAGDTDKVLPFEKKAAPDDCQKKQEKISQGSNITPGQRSQQQLSSESLKSTFSSKHSSLDVVIVKSKKTNPAISEKGRESQLTPSVVRENALNRKVKAHIISTLEDTPKNQETPIRETQSLNLSPSPLGLFSSHTAASFDMQHRRQDPDCVSRSVTSVAAGLCACLQFPFLRRKNLVAESREVLLKALRERHGPRLQENLLEVQRCFGADPVKKVQNQRPTMKDELLSDAFTTVFETDTASESYFDTKETTSFRKIGSLHFNWKSRPQPHQNLEQPAEWLTSPVETSVSILDNILPRPTYTPQFCMEFDPHGVSASDHLFSPTSWWGEKPSACQHWEDGFSKPKSKEALFDSFENNLMKHSRAAPERSSGSQYSGSNMQPFMPFQAQLPDRRSTEPMYFPQQKDPFETYRYSFAPSFSAQIHHPRQSFQPFGQCRHSPTRPPLQSHHTDMMRYPPSHMLERDPAVPRSSFPSPERWAFPPMRLY